MAKLVGIKVPRKKARAVSHTKRGGKVSGPSFEGWEEWTGERYHRFQQAARQHYYDEYNPNDLLVEVWTWMKNNNYTAEQIKNAKADKSNSISTTVSISCKLLNSGMPDYNPKHDQHWQSLAGTMGTVKPASDFVKEKIAIAIEKGALEKEQAVIEEEKKVEKYVPSIQERLKEASSLMSEFIEQAIDDFFVGKITDFKEIKVVNKLQSMQCKQPHARMIQNFYLPQMEELREVLTPVKLSPNASDEEKDWAEQLKEGYSHWDKKELKKLYDFYIGITSACDAIIAQSKATRKPRKISPKSPEKIVEKMKYKISDETYAISSIPPHKLVGATCLVVFNTKMRKLGIYYTSVEDTTGAGREGSGLTAKGTTLLRFDEEKSVWSTLRKPMDQLQEVKSLNTRKKFENWYSKLTTTPVKMNGRINPETILVAVY